MRSSTVAALAMAVAGIGLTAVPSGAAIIRWGTAVGGSYDNSRLWSTGTPPGSNDIALFNASGTNYVVTFPGNRISAQLLVGNDIFTMDLRKATYTIAAPLPNAIGISTNTGNRAITVFANGNVTSAGAYIGQAANSWGNIKVVNGTWTSSSTINVAAWGWGGLLISGGGTVNSVAGNVGINGVAGTVRLDGTGATWNVSQNLAVGHTSIAGSGVVNVVSGGLLNVGNLLDIRKGGSVTLDGGRIDAGQINHAGSFTFKSGTLNLTNAYVTLDANSLFGKTLSLSSLQSLNITKYLTVASDSQLSLNNTAYSAAQTINYGLVSLGGNSSVLGSMLNNYNRVSGNGTISTNVNNQADGTLYVPTNAQMLFKNTSTTNSGRVVVSNNATADFSGAVVHTGSVVLASSGQVHFGGNVSGGGDFLGDGTVTFDALYSPGAGPEQISFGGDVVFTPKARLRMDIGAPVQAAQLVSGSSSAPRSAVVSTPYDQLDVAKSITLSNIDVSLASGFQPTIGDVYNLVMASSINYGDSFHLNLPTLKDAKFQVMTTPTVLSLAVIPVPEPSTIALLGAAGAVALLGRRRRRA